MDALDIIDSGNANLSQCAQKKVGGNATPTLKESKVGRQLSPPTPLYTRYPNPNHVIQSAGMQILK